MSPKPPIETLTGSTNDDRALLRIDGVDVCWVTLVDEYRPGVWQVQTEDGNYFLVSTHVLVAPDGDWM